MLSGLNASERRKLQKESRKESALMSIIYVTHSLLNAELLPSILKPLLNLTSLNGTSIVKSRSLQKRNNIVISI